MSLNFRRSKNWRVLQEIEFAPRLHVGVVFNVLCNSMAKEDRLVESVRRLDSTHNLEFRVRIRGSHGDAARARLSKILVDKNVPHRLLGASPNATWREATALQVESLETPLILMCQEDHWLIDSQALNHIIESCSNASIDYCRTTFFPQSHQTLKEIRGYSRARFVSTGNCEHMYFEMPSETMPFRHQYAVGLVGLFSREYLLKLLYEPLRFPLFYGHETPFVFERKFGERAVYPGRLGFPKEEAFACVDDDLGVQGYSLISRGLAEGTRTISHRGSILDKLSLLVAGFFGAMSPTAARRMQYWLGMPIWTRNYLLYRFAISRYSREPKSPDPG